MKSANDAHLQKKNDLGLKLEEERTLEEEAGPFPPEPVRSRQQCALHAVVGDSGRDSHPEPLLTHGLRRTAPLSQ